MLQATDEGSAREWLSGRLKNSLCSFFGALTNQDLHDHSIQLARQYEVNISASFAVRHYIGGPPDLIPEGQNAIIARPVFCFNEADLEKTAAEAYGDAKYDANRKQRSIIALCSDFYLILVQILKNGERNQRFNVITAS